jgi:hypothetical protein
MLYKQSTLTQAEENEETTP